MAKLKEELWKTLQQLTNDEFKLFKWFLKDDDVLEGFGGIAAAKLEGAERQDTVDLMVQKYHDSGILQVTLEIFKKMSRNDLHCLLEKNLQLKGKSRKGKHMHCIFIMDNVYIFRVRVLHGCSFDYQYPPRHLKVQYQNQPVTRN